MFSFLSTTDRFRRTARLGVSAAIVATSGLVALGSPVAAATPVVDVTIEVDKTGSEPFDLTTWDGVDLATAGTDVGTENDVVRLQDSITYRVEASVNDGAVDDLVADVVLDAKQRWIEIPSACKTSLSIFPDLSPVSAIVDSVTGLEGGDARRLICNFGAAIEGTKVVAFPVSRAIGASTTGEVTLNDDTVGATVSASGTSAANGASNTATDGPTEVTVTADFKVNLLKELKVTAVDGDGEPVYAPQNRPGLAGQDGMIMEYKIKAQYQQGSLIADSDELTFLENYDLVDYYTDDNLMNNGALSSGAVLYTWDGGTGCSLNGDHGATAAVACTPRAVAEDFSGPGLVPDGLLDPSFDIALTDIDVRDPDGDANLFEIDVVLWFNEATEIATHQSCDVGVCENFVINGTGVYDASVNPSSVGFNPISTEGAAPDFVQLDNYGGAGEPHPADTFVTWPLIFTNPGTFSTRTSFEGINVIQKPPEQKAAPGQIVPVLSNVFDYRLIDGARSQLCQKFDLENFEFVGLSAGSRTDTGYSFNNQANNPSMVLFSPTTSFNDGTDYVSYLYTDAPMATLTDLQNGTCDDDVNGDNVVVFMDAAGNVSGPGAVDWYTDPDDIPGGRENVSRVRAEQVYDLNAMLALDPTHTRWAMATTYEVRVKQTAVGYGTEKWAPTWMSSRKDSGPGTDYDSWAGPGTASTVPDDVAFGYNTFYADRMTLVPSGISVGKVTVPAGLKVVLGGDNVMFEIEPTVIGIWDDVNNNTANISDNLPPGTTYVYGTEQFSTDSGATWLTYTEYQASSPDVTITNLSGGGHSAGADPLVWNFGSVDNGDQLPLIRYVVNMDEDRTSGNFTNTVTMASPIGADNDGDGFADTVSAAYQLSIVATFGFDVFKTIDRRIFEPNEPFETVLNYRNLGGESYSPGVFIDVLPFNGDGSVVGTGGVVASREPGSVFDGTLSVTNLVGASGETFEATDAASATVSNDPCHSSNLGAGEVPVPGDLCYLTFVDNGNALPDGPVAGTGLTTWVSCSALSDPVDCGGLDPATITAIRFTTSTIPAGSPLRAVTIELTPAGNTPGTPALDAFGDVTAASTGDIYTNSFGGRVPEIALRTISNDVTVTIVGGSISGHVDIDEDESATRNAGDTPIPSVDLLLLIEDPANPGSFIPFLIDDPANPGTLIPYVVTTQPDGSYMFDNVPSGNFQVVVDTTTTPDGMVASYDPDGGLDLVSAVTLFGPANPEPGFGAADYLDVDDIIDQDFGLVQRGAVGDTIFLDANSDGVQDAGDTGLAGVDVIVTYLGADGVPGGGDDVDYPATTDVDGMYLVENLPFGNYSVAVDESTVPATLGATYDNDGGFDSVSTTSLSEGDPVDLDQDFGYGVLGSIGDTIWFDQDLDGVQDVGEDGLGGIDVTVTWLGPDGVAGGGDDVVFTTTTDADGMYLIEDLPAGEYTVEVDETDLPAGMTPTFDADGGDDSTSALTLGAGEDNLDQDFGYAGAGSIGDTVYLDRDGDGVFEPNAPDLELGLEGVEVQLVHYGPDGVLGGDDDSFFTTFTGPGGTYLFENLPIGMYDVTVVGGVTLLENTDDPDNTGTGDNTSQTELTVAVPDDLDQDFGYNATSVLGDKVWLDIDGDGVYDPLDGEVGLPGVDILVEGPFGFSEVVTTDENGDYIVPNIPDGDYTLTVDPASLPPGLVQTFDSDGVLDSTSTSELVTADLTQDFGYNGDGQIGDTIWLDFDGDGVIDLADGEFGLEGVTVTLEWTLPGGGVITFTTTTDSDGNYLFENLPNGDYTVTVDTSTLPAGLVETFDFDGADDSTSAVTLVDGDNVNLDQDFGYNGTGSIGDTIWFDRDGDGVLDADETGIAGVDVTLVWDGPSGPVTLTTTTDADGNYLFDNLPPGDYTVTVDVADLPAGMSPTFDANGGDDSTSSLTLADGEDNEDQDFGYNGAGSIGDTVYIDVDGDGVQGPDEPGVAGQQVDLIWGGPDGVIGGGDDVVYTTTTGPDGEYLFPGLVPSEYTVTVVGGIVDAATNTGDPGADGDSTNTLTLADGEENLDQDFGYQGNNGLGDTVWLDLNADGVDDGVATEPRLEGVDVIVTWFGPDGVEGGGDDVVVATATTNADGVYLVGSLPDGNFSVTVDPSTLPAGIDTNTYDNDGDLNGTSIVTDLGVGTDDPQVDLDQDFGYTGMASIGDTIFLDLDGDGVQDPDEPGVPGVVVTVTSPGLDGIPGTADDIVVVVVTDDDGMYLVDGLPAGTTVVSYDPETLPPSYLPDSDLDGGDVTTVTVELENGDDVRDVDFGLVGDATVEGTVWIDTDNDGVQDPDEVGIPGVTVEVTWDGPNGPIVITTVTDADGNWTIPNVPSGDYTTQVDLTTLPTGLVPTTPTDGNTVVPAGGSGRVDNGFVPAASVGDRIWEDTNGDGVQDPGEPGVPGVTITLTRPDGTIVGTTTTGPNGDYVFGDLPPGDYVITVDPTTVPTGYIVSVDPDGTPDGSVDITLGPGEDRTDVDFGVVIPELPRTGIYIAMTLMVALGFLLAGFVLLGARRRRDVLTVS